MLLIYSKEYETWFVQNSHSSATLWPVETEKTGGRSDVDIQGPQK